MPGVVARYAARQHSVGTGGDAGAKRCMGFFVHKRGWRGPADGLTTTQRPHNNNVPCMAQSVAQSVTESVAPDGPTRHRSNGRDPGIAMKSKSGSPWEGQMMPGARGRLPLSRAALVQRLWKRPENNHILTVLSQQLLGSGCVGW